MLDVLRNSAKGTAGKIIVGLIVITFVLFGAESITQIVGNSAPATVNGEDVSEVDFQRLLSLRQQELASQYGAELAAQFASSSFLQDEIIESLISQTLQSQMTVGLKLDASEDQVIKSIVNLEVFQRDGKFNQDQYQNVLSSNGYNHKSFIEEQVLQTALTQMQAGVSNSAFVVDKVTNRYAQLIAQERTVRYKEFSASDFVDDVVVSDEELDAYYQENESLFLSDEKVKVKYFTVSLEDVAKEMIATDSEIQSAFETYLASITSDETREISHILFADGDDQEAQASAALVRLQNGEAFSDLAAELSDDPGSAEFGGSLGVLIPGVYVEEFYDAASSLVGEGDISGLVQTDYGVHLIRLDSLTTVEPESLEDKQEQLVADIKGRKARDEMILVQAQLSDLAFSTDVLTDVAQNFQSEVMESSWITRSGNAEPFSDSAVIEAAFSSQVINDGLISDVVRLANGDLIAVQKVEYSPEAVKPFADVKENVLAALTAVKSAELMRDKLNAVLAEKAIGDEWVTDVVINRENSDLPSEVVNKAFALPSGDNLPSVGVTEGDDVAYAVAVISVNDIEPDEEVLSSAQQFASQVSGSLQFQVMYNLARDEADIKIRRQ